MYRLTNISSQVVTLVKVSDGNINYIKVLPSMYIEVDKLSDYVNLINLIDPRIGLFKISVNN